MGHEPKTISGVGPDILFVWWYHLVLVSTSINGSVHVIERSCDVITYQHGSRSNARLHVVYSLQLYFTALRPEPY